MVHAQELLNAMSIAREKTLQKLPKTPGVKVPESVALNPATRRAWINSRPWPEGPIKNEKKK